MMTKLLCLMLEPPLTMLSVALKLARLAVVVADLVATMSGAYGFMVPIPTFPPIKDAAYFLAVLSLNSGLDGFGTKRLFTSTLIPYTDGNGDTVFFTSLLLSEVR